MLMLIERPVPIRILVTIGHYWTKVLWESCNSVHHSHAGQLCTRLSCATDPKLGLTTVSERQICGNGVFRRVLGLRPADRNLEPNSDSGYRTCTGTSAKLRGFTGSGLKLLLLGCSSRKSGNTNQNRISNAPHHANALSATFSFPAELIFVWLTSRSLMVTEFVRLKAWIAATKSSMLSRLRVTRSPIMEAIKTHFCGPEMWGSMIKNIAPETGGHLPLRTWQAQSVIDGATLDQTRFGTHVSHTHQLGAEMQRATSLQRHHVLPCSCYLDLAVR